MDFPKPASYRTMFKFVFISKISAVLTPYQKKTLEAEREIITKSMHPTKFRAIDPSCRENIYNDATSKFKAQ